jgi:hypothetical protein
VKPRAASGKKGGRKPAIEAQPGLVTAIEAVSADDTAGLFKELGLSCRAAYKARYERQGWPILGIDTKKKEILGNFHHPGRALTDGWVLVQDHDFVTADQRLVPYGVYDV